MSLPASASTCVVSDSRGKLLRAAVIGSLAWASLAQGLAEPSPSKTTAAALTVESLQRQVDELGEGQKLLLEEIAALRRLLQETQGRGEVAAHPEPPPFFTLNVRGEPFRGGTNARVAVVAFSDFHCSFCSQFEKETFPRIDERYVRTGRIKYLFRDLPDRADADALAKAEAARCAGEQGRFWEMHDQLFADPLQFAGENVARHLGKLGIDAPRFAACLDSHRYREPIRRSTAIASRMGIHGTPAFLVGTIDASGDVIQSVKVFTGAESFETFRALLDGMLQPSAKAEK